MNDMQKIEVLDHGFVCLEEFIGGAHDVVNCARVSTSDERVDADTISQKDLILLEHLACDGHHTPFEHVVFRFRVKAPIFVMRQWMRHRIGSFNERSLRYRKPTFEFYIPDDMPDEAKRDYQLLLDMFTAFYQEHYGSEDRTERARQRELLRCAIPVSAYTEAVWTVNLRSLVNFVKLRSSEHAQAEMRRYAEAVYTLAKTKTPGIPWRDLLE